MGRKAYIGTALLLLLSDPEVIAQAQEAVRLEDPALYWARGAALAASVFALAIVAYTVYVRRVLDTTSKWLLLIGLVMLPVFVLLSGTAAVMDESKQVAACATCHVMHPFVNDLKSPASETLAARHYKNRWIPDDQCYSCHTDYNIFGEMRAKVAGVGHLYAYYIGRYHRPIRIRRPHRNSICLHCHGPAVKYQKVELHQEMAADIRTNKTTCIECHGPAHPAPETRARR